jgi:hypothetical protein
VFLCVFGRYMCVNVYAVNTYMSMLMWWLHVCLCVSGEYLCVNVYVESTCVSMCIW